MIDDEPNIQPGCEKCLLGQVFGLTQIWNDKFRDQFAFVALALISRSSATRLEACEHF